MSGWGSKWPESSTGKAIAKRQAEAGKLDYVWPDISPTFDKDADKVMNKASNIPKDWHTHTSDELSLGWDNEARKLSNKVPTHDPYTNPGAYLYYECKCGAALDPKVKRFAALNDAASEAGWKVRWGAQYYVPYCVECGKDVE
jgi:hypothetical protein